MRIKPGSAVDEGCGVIVIPALDHVVPAPTVHAMTAAEVGDVVVARVAVHFHPARHAVEPDAREQFIVASQALDYQTSRVGEDRRLSRAGDLKHVCKAASLQLFNVEVDVVLGGSALPAVAAQPTGGIVNSEKCHHPAAVR